MKLFTELVKNGHPEFRQNLLKQTVPLNDASSKSVACDVGRVVYYFGVLLIELRCTDPNLAGDVGRIRDLAKVDSLCVCMCASMRTTTQVLQISTG